MTDQTPEQKPLTVHDETVPAFGYELIREVLLKDLLGKEAPGILYWAGKRLARKYPLASIDEMISFFSSAGWGNLMLLNESKNEMDLELSSAIISARCKNDEDCAFQLEAGFIAEQIEQQKGYICEAFEHPKKRKGKVLFTVKWDKKDTI
ncbi:YslB family protein [Cytobacillus gottheilii]|uniref:YslB family protein n=1 Tax=Cytobacillus gottheilii TaxID=859144 RepID=A0ABX8FAU9_9BACI|nr:YslB family protein [Cytobacillus gottheilii]QVY60596.1 YslB family protein [Cytobacillus gottheilii]